MLNPRTPMKKDQNVRTSVHPKETQSIDSASITVNDTDGKYREIHESARQTIKNSKNEQLFEKTQNPYQTLTYGAPGRSQSRSTYYSILVWHTLKTWQPYERFDH